MEKFGKSRIFSWEDFLQTEISIAHFYIVFVVIVWEGSNAIKRANKYRKCDCVSCISGTGKNAMKENILYNINKILLESIVNWTLDAYMHVSVCLYSEWGTWHTLTRGRSTFGFGVRLLPARVRSQTVDRENFYPPFQPSEYESILTLKNQTHHIVKTIKWNLFADD